MILGSSFYVLENVYPKTKLELNRTSFLLSSTQDLPLSNEIQLSVHATLFVDFKSPF